MPDAYVNQAATSLSQLVWSKALQWPYRNQLNFADIAVARATAEGGQNGKSVSFIFPNDIALATTPLDEVINPDAVTMTDSTVNVTIQEYGNTMISTALARATGIVDVDQVLVNLLGFNAGASIDAVAADVLAASTNLQIAGGGTALTDLAATDTLKTNDLEILNANFKTNNVPTFSTGNYRLLAHPLQILDLRNEVNSGGFRYPRENGGVGGELLSNGAYQFTWAGFDIMSANNVTVTTNASGFVDAYKAIAVGADALAKGYTTQLGADPRVIFGLPTDPMMRRHPVSWHAMLGFKILRQAAVRVLATSASQANNAA